jgi:hypothetical protein
MQYGPGGGGHTGLDVTTTRLGREEGKEGGSEALCRPEQRKNPPNHTQDVHVRVHAHYHAQAYAHVHVHLHIHVHVRVT